MTIPTSVSGSSPDPFTLRFTTCDHGVDDRRICSHRPTFVVILTISTGECVWSAACGRHIMSAINECRDLMAALSLPHNAYNYCIGGSDDRRIIRGTGAPITLDRNTLDVM